MGIIGTRRSRRHVKIKVVEKLGNFPLRYLEADYVLHIEKNHLNNLSRKYTWIVDPDLSDFASLKKPITHITDCIHVRDWVFHLRNLKIFYNIYILRILCTLARTFWFLIAHVNMSNIDEAVIVRW